MNKIAKEVKGVIFDLDGTLVVSDLDFAAIRSEGGVPDGVPVLEYLDGADGPERELALRVLLEHEERAAHGCRLQPGARHVLEALRGMGMKLALLTRNSRNSVQHVVSRFGLLFDCCVAREDAEPKPSPQPVLMIAERLGLRPEQLLVVGDYVFDIESGLAAGALTALLRTDKELPPHPRAHVVLNDLMELLDHFPPQEAV